jgi:hypothetical protein
MSFKYGCGTYSFGLRKGQIWTVRDDVAAVNMKITVFWGRTPCSLVGQLSMFRGNLMPSFFYPEDGGVSLLRNAGTFLPNCMAEH